MHRNELILAQQLYMCIAAMAQRYNLELYQTDDSDATPTRDLFTAGVKLDSPGIRVIVHRENER